MQKTFPVMSPLEKKKGFGHDCSSVRFILNSAKNKGIKICISIYRDGYISTKDNPLSSKCVHL